MAKKKAAADRHLPFRQVRIPLALYLRLKALADRHDRAITRELRRAVEAYLDANEPPPGQLQ
jgi:predicted DNA-binding protein